jgi:hypothetical protein
VTTGASAYQIVPDLLPDQYEAGKEKTCNASKVSQS